MTLSGIQRLFVFVCRKLLLISYFKRYWPIGGSYWNKHHIDKNHASDLRQVISDAQDYTRQHVQQTFGLVVVYLAMLYAQDMPRHTNYCFLAALVMEGYAFAAHHYNRILARQQLLRLGETEQTQLMSEAEEPIFAISETNLQWNTFAQKGQASKSRFYSVIYRPSYQRMSPLLQTWGEAARYQDYLTRAWLDQNSAQQIAQFSKRLFVNRHAARDMYRSYLNLIHEAY